MNGGQGASVGFDRGQGTIRYEQRTVNDTGISSGEVQGLPAAFYQLQPTFSLNSHQAQGPQLYTGGQQEYYQQDLQDRDYFVESSSAPVIGVGERANVTSEATADAQTLLNYAESVLQQNASSAREREVQFVLADQHNSESAQAYLQPAIHHTLDGSQHYSQPSGQSYKPVGSQTGEGRYFAGEEERRSLYAPTAVSSYSQSYSTPDVLQSAYTPRSTDRAESGQQTELRRLDFTRQQSEPRESVLVQETTTRPHLPPGYQGRTDTVIDRYSDKFSEHQGVTAYTRERDLLGDPRVYSQPTSRGPFHERELSPSAQPYSFPPHSDRVRHQSPVDPPPARNPPRLDSPRHSLEQSFFLEQRSSRQDFLDQERMPRQWGRHPYDRAPSAQSHPPEVRFVQLQPAPIIIVPEIVPSGIVPLDGFIFGCNNRTKMECFRRQLFALPRANWSQVQRLVPGSKLFLFNFDTRELYGVFEAVSAGQMDIEPDAFAGHGSFPAQVKIRCIEQCPPLKEAVFKGAIQENYFTAKKFNYQLSAVQVERLVGLYLAERGNPASYLAPADLRHQITERRGGFGEGQSLPAGSQPGRGGSRGRRGGQRGQGRGQGVGSGAGAGAGGPQTGQSSANGQHTVGKSRGLGQGSAGAQDSGAGQGAGGSQGRLGAESPASRVQGSATGGKGPASTSSPQGAGTPQGDGGKGKRPWPKSLSTLLAEKTKPDGLPGGTGGQEKAGQKRPASDAVEGSGPKSESKRARADEKKTGKALANQDEGGVEPAKGAGKGVTSGQKAEASSSAKAQAKAPVKTINPVELGRQLADLEAAVKASADKKKSANGGRSSSGLTLDGDSFMAELAAAGGLRVGALASVPTAQGVGPSGEQQACTPATAVAPSVVAEPEPSDVKPANAGPEARSGPSELAGAPTSTQREGTREMGRGPQVASCGGDKLDSGVIDSASAGPSGNGAQQVSAAPSVGAVGRGSEGAVQEGRKEAGPDDEAMEAEAPGPVQKAPVDEGVPHPEGFRGVQGRGTGADVEMKEAEHASRGGADGGRSKLEGEQREPTGLTQSAPSQGGALHPEGSQGTLGRGAGKTVAMGKVEEVRIAGEGGGAAKLEAPQTEEMGGEAAEEGLKQADIAPGEGASAEPAGPSGEVPATSQASSLHYGVGRSRKGTPQEEPPEKAPAETGNVSERTLGNAGIQVEHDLAVENGITEQTVARGMAAVGEGLFGAGETATEGGGQMRGAGEVEAGGQTDVEKARKDEAAEFIGFQSGSETGEEAGNRREGECKLEEEKGAESEAGEAAGASVTQALSQNVKPWKLLGTGQEPERNKPE